MVTPATSQLGRLIDDYQRRHSASLSGLADRIGITRQTLRQWRVGELRSLPTQSNLAATAAEIGCPYSQVLNAALHDAGYLGTADPSAASPGLAAVAASPFIQNAIVSARYTPTAIHDDWLCETAHGPAVWTLAHRGYSGSRRLDLWAYPDEHSALRAAARLGLECGLDEDLAAVKAFEAGDYQSVLDRHRDTAPEWQVLAVTLCHFIDNHGEFVVTSEEIGHGTPPTSPDPHDALSDDLEEGDDEFADIADMITPQQANLIAQAADDLAADIRRDADALGSDPLTDANRDQARVLSSLPPVTFDQSLLWRYQLAEAAERLGADTRRWGAPIPRCTGEEMVLHLILGRAKALARPRQVRRGSWDLLSEVLFQDHDVLTLFDVPPDAVESLAGGVHLHPRRWFSEFALPFPMPDRPDRPSVRERVKLDE